MNKSITPAAREAADCVSDEMARLLQQAGYSNIYSEPDDTSLFREAFARFEEEITSPLIDVAVKLGQDNARLRAGFNKLCDDMAYATSGGMSWITHAEVEEFKRRAKEFGLEHTPTEEDA